MSGEIASESLTAEEGVVFDAEIDAHLEDRLVGDDHVARRASQGHASVALDESGRMVEFGPDGTSAVLAW